MIPKHLDLQASFFAGNGIGRYGSGGLPDVTSRQDGTLVGIPETMWLAGGTFHANKDWDFYGFAGSEDERDKKFAINSTTAVGYGAGLVASNAGCSVEGGACSPLTKTLDQYTGGSSGGSSTKAPSAAPSSASSTPTPSARPSPTRSAWRPRPPRTCSSPASASIRSKSGQIGPYLRTPAVHPPAFCFGAVLLWRFGALALRG